MAKPKTTRSRKKVANDAQTNLLDVTSKLRTAPCIPALREAVRAWRAGGYKGVTDTTRRLLSHWFHSDHVLPSGGRFAYHSAQREAIETLIFVWEFERVRTRNDLLERYATDVKDLILPPVDDFARYATKMATGSGKTKVMALAIAWQFLNAQREAPDVAADYATTFLVLAPNVIVMERLRTDFGGGRIFEADPIIPKDLRMFWDFDCVIRGDGERAHAEGTLFLTNIQQFYERVNKPQEDEPGAITAVMGKKPPAKKLEMTDFGDRIALRHGRLLVINDEAHHTHAEDSEWNNVIKGLHAQTPIAAQLDFSATPRFAKGALFPWTISDYPLKQAIMDQIVKWPMRGVANITEAKSSIASIRYEGYLVAGVERWKEYVTQLAPLNKKPILFIMLTDTDEAEDVGDWLRKKYPDQLGGEQTLVIHTNTTGEITKADLDIARKLAREVDEETSNVNAIVSVLMLREGWDVQNVTVVLGLRPYTAKANILPEQAIGRGLRLMFRGQGAVGYRERVDIIGNPRFLEFVDDLEKLEDMKLGSFELGKDKLKILAIGPQPDRAPFDIEIPMLSPALVRKKSLAEEIAALDVKQFKLAPIPMRIDKEASKTFKYEGYDVITLEKEIERDYAIPQPQTAQEVIGYYARRIAEQVKLPSQFAALAPKVREFFEVRAFGQVVDLDDQEIVRSMATPLAHFVTVKTFAKVLAGAAIAEREPEVIDAGRPLSSCQPFPWSQLVYEAKKTIFNLVPCENELEKSFAHFLEGALDVVAFAKLPTKFAFSIEYLDENQNLRLYYPDFVAVDDDGMHYLLETKGQNTTDVECKDAAARNWCDNATTLTGRRWLYCKVMEADFKKLQPMRVADLLVLVHQT